MLLKWQLCGTWQCSGPAVALWCSGIVPVQGVSLRWGSSSGSAAVELSRTLSSRTRQKLHTSSFQLWCLPLPGTSVSLLKSCLQWRCRWCGTQHRNYTPFFLCTHGTCVQNCKSQMQCKASRLYINHPGSIPIFLLSFCSGEEELLFVPEVIQENSEWSLVSSLFIFLFKDNLTVIFGSPGTQPVKEFYAERDSSVKHCCTNTH